MTFAHEVKNEICHNKALLNHQALPLLYGLLLFGRRYEEEAIVVSTEHKAVARLCGRLIFSQIPMAASVTTKEIKGSFEKSTYFVTVDDENDRRAVLHFFDEQGGKAFLSSQSVQAFLAGAFLSAGNLSDPEKDYHFEIICPSEDWAEQLLTLLGPMEIPAHRMVRRDNPVVYVKDSEAIQALLTLFGAHKAVMQMLNVKIVKDLRNHANRVTNCETSNIMKSASAAASQLRDIEYLQQRGKLETLPAPLKDCAHLRLENPEASLRELAEIGQISRSGMNHRLKKIGEIAKELREQED